MTTKKAPAKKKTTKKVQVPTVVDGLEKIRWYNTFTDEEELYQVHVNDKGTEFFVYDVKEDQLLNKGKPFTTKPSLEEIMSVVSKFAAARA